jgi:hypothetical protein
MKDFILVMKIMKRKAKLMNFAVDKIPPQYFELK